MSKRRLRAAQARQVKPQKAAPRLSLHTPTERCPRCDLMLGGTEVDYACPVCRGKGVVAIDRLSPDDRRRLEEELRAFKARPVVTDYDFRRDGR